MVHFPGRMLATMTTIRVSQSGFSFCRGYMRAQKQYTLAFPLPRTITIKSFHVTPGSRKIKFHLAEMDLYHIRLEIYQ
jgi:hypothetical protein